MIDLHTHILPALDDGVATLEEARALALVAIREGVTAVAATPHVRADYPTTSDEMENGVAAVRADFAEQGIPLQVLHGGEIDLTTLKQLSGSDLRRFTIAQNGCYLIVEFPYVGWPLELANAIFDLTLRGITPILAHPERNREVQAAPERLAPLVDGGALIQVTAASLDGRLGHRPRKAAFQLLNRRLVHVLASDAHAPSVRAFALAAACASLNDESLATYLTETVPSAIAQGDAVPPRI